MKSLARADFEKLVQTVPLDVKSLAKDQRLSGVDLNKADLDGDGKIAGAKEARALFEALDALDTDKSARSLQLIDGDDKPTPMKARIDAIRDQATAGPTRPHAPGPQPPVPEAVRTKQRYPVDTERAFGAIDANKSWANHLVKQAMGQLGLYYDKGRDDLLFYNLRQGGKSAQVFDAVATALEAKVKKGELSTAQGEAILFAVFEKVASEGPAIVARYKKSPLTDGVRNRDTDGDGLRDVDELAKGSDRFENRRIATSGGRDTVAERREALDDALHNPVRANPKKGEGTHQTYVGDQGLAYGDKNGGYAYFTPKAVANPRGGPDLIVPDRLDLGGRRVSVKPTVASYFHDARATALVIERGGERVVALPGANNSLAFYAPTTTMTKDSIVVDGKYYAPWTGGESKKLTDLAIGFQHAYVSANTGRARVSPAEHDLRTAQFAEARKGETVALTGRLDAQTRAAIDASVKNIEAANAAVATGTEKFLEHYQDLVPLLQAGYLKIDIDDASGKVKLSLLQGKLGNDDFAKLGAMWGEKLKRFEASMTDKSEGLAKAIAAREWHAAQYLQYANSADFTTYLETLPPEARSAEMAKLAQALMGTKAGQQLGDELRKGLRDPASVGGIVRMIIDEPTPRSATTANNLSVVAQVGAASAKWVSERDRHAMYFSLVTGRSPTAQEVKVIDEMVAAQATAMKMNGPDAVKAAALQGLMKDVFTKYPGPASHVLHAYGHTMHHAWEHANKKTIAWAHKYPGGSVMADELRAPSWGQKGVMIGAAGFSVVSFGFSLSHAMHDPSVTNVAHAAVEGLNMAVMLAGTAESFMKVGAGAEFLGKVGKFGGPLVAAAHVVMDVAAYGDKNSREGRDKATLQIAGSAAIFAGALLASNPAGWVLAGGGLLIKLFAGSTDPRYEDAYGKLRDLPWGHWE